MTGTAPAARSAASAAAESDRTLLSSTSRIDDRADDRGGVGEVGEHGVRRARGKRGHVVAAGGDRYRSRADPAAAGDIARSISYDHTRTAQNSLSDVSARAVALDRGKIVPVFAVAAVRAHAKTPEVYSHHAQLSLRALDNISGEQPEHDVVARLELIKEGRNARQQLDPVIVAPEFDHQLREIAREHGLHL